MTQTYACGRSQGTAGTTGVFFHRTALFLKTRYLPVVSRRQFSNQEWKLLGDADAEVELFGEAGLLEPSDLDRNAFRRSKYLALAD
jgi:hypothetical protein